MAWTPDKVAALISSRGDTSARAAQLKEVLDEIRAENNDSLAALVEKLADGARDYENRARVVESCALPRFVMEIMKNPEANAFLPFAIAAALNASEAGLSKVLVDIVSGDQLSSCESSLSHIMTILELLCNQDTEPKVANPRTPALLLDLATGDGYDADLDTFIEICTPALAYLTFQDLQPVLLEGDGIELLQRAFHQLYTRFDTSDNDPDTARQLKQSATPLQLIHAALSFLKNLAIPEVNKAHLGAALLDPTNPLLPRLWTSTRTQPQLQFAAVSLTRLLLAKCPANVRLLCGPLTSDPDQPPRSASNLALLTATAASADEDPIKLEAARAAALVCRALHSSFPPSSTEILDPSWVWTSSSASSSQIPEDDRHHQNPALTAFYAAHATPSLPPALSHLLTQPRFPTLRSDAIFVLALMSRSQAAAGARLALQVLTLSQSSSSLSSSGSHGNATAAVGSGGGAGAGAGAGAGWQVLAKAITGSESDELAAVFKRQVVEVHDQGEEDAQEAVNNTEKKGEDREGGVTVEKLSLEPQPLDAQGLKQQPARAAQMDRENAMVLVAELLRQFPDELASLRRPLEAVLNKGGELVVQDQEQGKDAK
ncbi:hypothetical protein NEMBOFW57_008761 [Staphylotrichum longicolle]|uniref:GTP binding protein n=1 Tax=Staphylotrichum longicolle TaxID=669026 RepID=A0AAD4ESB4_9PEZI|nr:hypothetical protein NEMBOFW57_008761 [Staphylotrichum longicolle]